MLHVLTIEKVDFFERFLALSFSFRLMILIIFTLIAFLINLFSGLLFVLFLIYYFFKKFNESIVYITDIYYNEENEKIKIKYGKKNDYGFEINEPISNFKIEWFDYQKGIGTSSIKLVRNHNELLVQFEVGNWSKEKFKSIVKIIDSKSFPLRKE